MRTFDLATIEAASRSWDSFGWEWQAIRRLAAEQGYIYAPKGTEWDDREAASPSPRAIIWRALQDNPVKLAALVRRSRSWGQVVSGVIGMEASLRENAGETERDTTWSRKDEPDHRVAATSIKAILQRIADS